jgi:beta-lactamase regulating signal transducer with metallopeptidase domain
MSDWVQEPATAAAWLDVTLKSFVLLAAAGVTCVFWPRASASLRHSVWLAAVASLLVLPLLSFVLPGWKRPLWSIAAERETGRQVAVAIDFIPNAGAWAFNPPEHASDWKFLPPRAGGNPVPARQRIHFRAGWLACAMGIWLAGVALTMGWLAVGWARLRDLRRKSAQPPGEEWMPLLREGCSRLTVRRPVALVQSSGSLIPITWGSWRPVILLPTEAERWPAERRRVVLLHELAHIKRWDCLTQSLTRIACALYCFNPLVWLAARRMCIEREAACDDLVLNTGCLASEYAGHLVDIARGLEHAPRVAAIAMARSSRLENRVRAIVDASRVRRAPRAVLVVLLCLGATGLVTLAAQKPKPEPEPALAASAVSGTPWFDARLRAFFAAKSSQARRLAGEYKEPLDPNLWPYFDAGMAGDWRKVRALMEKIHPSGSWMSGPPAVICGTTLWQPVLETYSALDEFAGWKEKHVLAFGNDIIKSIPRGSIYFGGTDPGRFVVTALSKSHIDGDPFFTVTQNALGSDAHLRYLREMYGARIYVPTGMELTNAMNQYIQDAEKRRKEHKLLPGEGPDEKRGWLGNYMSIIQINGLLSKLLFDKNPDRDFYVEESFPFEWMYPHLAPNGLILHLNRQPLTELSPDLVDNDHEYWSRYLEPMIGRWLNYATPVSNVTAFAEKVYLKKDLSGFKGDPEFIEDEAAQHAFAKLRSSTAGLYAWRLGPQCPPDFRPKTGAETQRLRKEADFAFRQAFVLCPTSPEALFRYVNFLIQFNRMDDALVVAKTCQKLDPTNGQVESLVSNLETYKESKSKRP